jgi:hypothetical protein
MNDIVPMMSKSELFLFEKYLSKDHVICEYGSGGSTKWIANKVNFIHSIEHNAEWFNKTSENTKNLKNVKIWHVPPVAWWNSKTEGTFEEFENYINFPLNIKTDFNLFFVDGRARVACCNFIFNNFPNATIIFHDYVNRAYDKEHNYSLVLNQYKMIECQDTLAIFKSK